MDNPWSIKYEAPVKKPPRIFLVLFFLRVRRFVRLILVLITILKYIYMRQEMPTTTHIAQSQFI